MSDVELQNSGGSSNSGSKNGKVFLCLTMPMLIVLIVIILLVVIIVPSVVLTLPKSDSAAQSCSIGAANPMIKSIDMPIICDRNTYMPFTFQTINFNQGDSYTFTLNNMPWNYSLSACNAGSNCTLLSINITAGDLAPGRIVVDVVPAASGVCPIQAEFFVEARAEADPQTVPAEYCVDQDVTLNINGRNLSHRAIWLTQISNARMMNITTGCYGNGTVPCVNQPNFRFISDSQLTIYHNASNPNSPQSGWWDLEIAKIGDCSIFIPNATFVHPKLVVFFVDPPVYYNQISLQVVLFTSGLDRAIRQVRFYKPGHNVVFPAANVSYLLSDAGATLFNRILITLRPGQLLPGNYSVEVTSAIGCLGIANDVVRVVDQTTFNITSVSPTYVHTGTDTGLTITTTPDLQAGPRVYLSPANGQGISAPLRAVVPRSSSSLTALYKADTLLAGTYSLIIVNQDGTVAALSPALQVLPDPTPLITEVQPVDYDGTVYLTIFGKYFDNGNTTTSSISLICKIAGVVGAETFWTNVTAAANATQFVLPVLTLPAGIADAFCLVILTRTTDGARTQFSGISVTNPSFKLNPYSVQGRLSRGKRAAATEVVSVSAASRYLLVIGGDNNITRPSALSEVETFALDFFGDIDTSVPRFMQPAALAVPVSYARSFAIGRFVYLVGGFDGTNAQNVIQRSLLLSPLETPTIQLDLDVVVGNETTFSQGGAWYYQVSALFGPNDANNPDGESLPGETLTINLPVIKGAGITLYLTWSAVPSAVGYRVYRSPVANSNISSITLLTTTTVNNLADNGQACVGGRVPLKEGTMGNWKQLSNSLTTARWGHAATFSYNPVDSTEGFFYVSHGRGDNYGTFTPLSSVEVCRVLIRAPSQRLASPNQTIASCSVLASVTTTARAYSYAHVLTNLNAWSTYGAPNYTLIISRGLGGTQASPVWDLNIEAWKINADGSLSGRSAATPPANDFFTFPGYCEYVSSSYLIDLGGTTSSAASWISLNGAQFTYPNTDKAAIQLGSYPATFPYTARNVASQIGLNKVAFPACRRINSKLYIVGGVGISTVNTLSDEVQIAIG